MLFYTGGMLINTHYTSQEQNLAAKKKMADDSF